MDRHPERQLEDAGDSTSPETPTRMFPVEAGVPNFLNQSAPRATMYGMLVSVSMLFTVVGIPHNPLFAGKGASGVAGPASPRATP